MTYLQESGKESFRLLVVREDTSRLDWSSATLSCRQRQLPAIIDRLADLVDAYHRLPIAYTDAHAVNHCIILFHYLAVISTYNAEYSFWAMASKNVCKQSNV